MYFEWGAGFAKVTNISKNDLYASATVLVYDNVTGEEVDMISNGDVCSHNKSVKAETMDYSTADYSFNCVGGIHAGTSPSTPILEDEDRYYPI